MPRPDPPVLLLLLAELRAAARSTELRFLLLAAAAAGVAAAHPAWFASLRDAWTDSLEAAPDIPDSDDPLCRPGEGDARRIALAADSPAPPPPWFRWHDPLLDDPGPAYVAPAPPAPDDPADPAPADPAAPARPDALLRFLPATPPDPGSADALRPAALQVEVHGLHPGAELEAIYACLARLRDAERQARLDDLGVTERPDAVVIVREVALPEDDEADDPYAGGADPFGLSLAAFLSLCALTWAYEALPGARQRGWLESLSAAPISPLAVVGGYTAICALWTLLNGALFCLGGLLSGQPPDPRWLLIPWIAATVAALSVRAFLPMPDLRSSSLRTAWVPLACMALGGLALLLERRWGIGGLVPLGGLALPWLGEATLGSRLLAMAVSVGVIALSLRSGAALLARDALGQNADPTDARRAAGRYGPEAALLFLLALAGGSVALVPIGAGAALRLLSGQLCFQLLPALLAPALLGLPAREALSLRAPPRRAWIAAPAVLVGTMSAGLLAMSLQIALLPDDPFSMLDYGGAVGELQAGWGLLCLTLGAGLCEELLFRGAIFGLLRRSGPSTRVAVAALIWQAVAFSLLHVLSFKLIPTGVIGLILGVLAWRTGSVWPGVVVHAAHNATALLGAQHLPEVFNPGMWGVQGHVVAAGLALFGGAAAWWAGEGRREREGRG